MRVVSMRPSAWRAGVSLVLPVGGCMAASGFTATGAEFWVGTGVLLGVVAVAFAAVWLMFVPIRLEFDRVELTIRYLLGRSRTLPWFELDLYGPSEGVFVLQFESKTFQIFSAAFSV